MKKRYLFLGGLLGIICICLFYFYVKKEYNYETFNGYEKRDNLNSGMLSIMLETEAKSGIYKKSEESTWPTKGYKFNAELSKCDNDGELSWDNDKKVVLMSANSINNCYVYFDLNSQTLAEYVMLQYTGVQGENAMYYHDSTLANGASDNSYRYAGADYVLTDKAKNAGYESILSGFHDNYQTNLIGIYKNDEECDYILYNTSASTNGYKVKYDENADYMTYYNAFKKAYNDGYIDYNVKNYVCYGTDTVPCPTNNLYRIIGVFEDNYHGVTGEQLVKLIKFEFASTTELGSEAAVTKTPGSYDITLMDTYKGTLTTTDPFYWSKNYNIWNDSILNTTALNVNFINYLNSINSKWVDSIETVKWQVAGSDNIANSVPKKAYEDEVISPNIDDLKSFDESFESPISARVGLMYASDYGFSVVPSEWIYTIENNDSSIRENWLFIGNYEWTITRYVSNTGSHSYFIDEQGKLGTSYSYSAGMVNVRPAFFLKSSVAYESGNRTMEDPIRVE